MSNDVQAFLSCLYLTIVVLFVAINGLRRSTTVGVVLLVTFLISILCFHFHHPLMKWVFVVFPIVCVVEWFEKWKRREAAIGWIATSLLWLVALSAVTTTVLVPVKSPEVVPLEQQIFFVRETTHRLYDERGVRHFEVVLVLSAPKEPPFYFSVNPQNPDYQQYLKAEPGNWLWFKKARQRITGIKGDIPLRTDWDLQEVIVRPSRPLPE